MAQQRCVYCLEYSDDITEDHVLARSWYSNTTPPNMPKWKILSCGKCNQKYSKIEGDLRISLGLCIDPNESKSAGIADKVLSALNPADTNDPKEQRIRLFKRKAILKESEDLEHMNIPKESYLPNFGSKENSDNSQLSKIRVDADDLNVFACKLVRGINYIIDQSFIEKGYAIEVFLEDTDPRVALINKFGKDYSCGPSITVKYAVANDDTNIRLYSIDIWGRLKIYAQIIGGHNTSA